MRTVSIASAALLTISVAVSQAGSGKAPPREVTAAEFARHGFDRSTRVDNRFFPLRPGTRYVFEGSTSEGRKRVPHSLVFTVTDLTKVIAGVRSVVVWDRDYSDGELVEAELSFFAQDNEGNVWHLGEYPEEYENGRFVKAPTWLHGLKGARAGIEMRKQPRTGTPSYSQGFAPAPVSWTDRARVQAAGLRTCVPVACFEDVLAIREFNAEEPGMYQLKYYAPGVGNVRVGWGGPKDADHETVALVKLVRLDAAALAGARREALKLEHHAYQVSKDVYARTAPARRS